jgi:mRNA-degrading endonuclease toxin of MazEF toxin-antitoxin module
MTRGNVYWIKFPSGSGRAQAGRRPAVIVQNDDASKEIPTVLVVPLTTQQDALRFPGTVLIDPDNENGLRQRSVALVFQMTAVDQQFLESRLGTVSESVMASLLSSLEEITAA